MTATEEMWYKVPNGKLPKYDEERIKDFWRKLDLETVECRAMYVFSLEEKKDEQRV